MTKRKIRPPSWSAVSLLALGCERPTDGRLLAVMVSPTDFVVMAFEVHNPPARGSSDVEAAGAIFAAHAHKVVGQAVSFAAAVMLAESYATAWLESDAAAETLCACREIGT